MCVYVYVHALIIHYVHSAREDFLQVLLNIDACLSFF